MSLKSQSHDIHCSFCGYDFVVDQSMIDSGFLKYFVYCHQCGKQLTLDDENGN